MTGGRLLAIFDRMTASGKNLSAMSLLLVLGAAFGCGGEPHVPLPPDPNPIVPPATTPPPPPPPPPGPPPGADIVIAINTAERFQTINGFGVSMRLFNDPHLIFLAPGNTLQISAAAQAQILDSLYVGIGLTRVRLGNYTRFTEPENDNTDPEVTDLSKFNFAGLNNDAFFPVITDLRRRTPLVWWSSPGQLELWMNEGNPEEYVEWAMAVLRRWRSQGLEMPFYSIINEPSYVYSGVWSGNYVRDVVKLLGRKLKAEGFATRLVIPDDITPDKAAAIARTVLADPEARGYVGAIAFHLYGSLATASELKALSKQYGIPLWMSEWFLPKGMQWAETVHSLLSDYDVAAVDYLFGFYGGPSEVQLISLLHSGINYQGFRTEEHFHFFGNYTKYVRPGAVRVGVAAVRDDIKVTAFTRNGQLTIVAINSGGGDASTTVRFDIAGLTSNSAFAAVRTMTESGTTDRLKPLSPAALNGNSILVALPPRSVSTFFQSPP